ncbi:MAG: 30S ribosomal protein S9 [Candidatus Azambacteria bacterium]|nr:30S ribosomal protein S9 [Candidatus Azambacteria bacterium]
MSATKTATKIAVKRTPKEKKEEEVEITPVPVKSEEEGGVDIDIEKMIEEKDAKPGRYYEAVGRRKTATARVRLFTKGGSVFVNTKDYKLYFPQDDLQRIVDGPMRKMKITERFMVTAITKGGGIHAQAEAVRHGIARALVAFNADFQKRLKRSGYLKRDPRQKERKKFGLKKARKGPRWSKR